MNAKSKPFKRIINFLGLQNRIVALLAMVILVGLGERMAERFLPFNCSCFFTWRMENQRLLTRYMLG